MKSIVYEKKLQAQGSSRQQNLQASSASNDGKSTQNNDDNFGGLQIASLRGGDF